MKRFCIGIAILVILALSGWIIHRGMSSVHQPIARHLHDAAQAALDENWENALLHARQAAQLWEKHHRFTAAFADHTPMDEVDGLFAELHIFAQEREMPHFAAICLHLRRLTLSMAGSHSISWWNLL